MKSKCNSMSLAALPADPPNRNHCNTKGTMNTRALKILAVTKLLPQLLLWSLPAVAQTFTTVHSFTSSSDGGYPEGS